MYSTYVPIPHIFKIKSRKNNKYFFKKKIKFPLSPGGMGAISTDYCQLNTSCPLQCEHKTLSGGKLSLQASEGLNRTDSIFFQPEC